MMDWAATADNAMVATMWQSHLSQRDRHAVLWRVGLDNRGSRHSSSDLPDELANTDSKRTPKNWRGLPRHKQPETQEMEY